MFLVEEGDLRAVQEMLATQNVKIDAQNKSGQTALALATRNANYHISVALVDHGANVNTRNKVNN